jgi:hypothetical protein
VHIFIVINFNDLVTYHPVGTMLWWIALGLIANMVSLPPATVGALAPSQTQETLKGSRVEPQGEIVP